MEGSINSHFSKVAVYLSKEVVICLKDCAHLDSINDLHAQATCYFGIFIGQLTKIHIKDVSNIPMYGDSKCPI